MPYQLLENSIRLEVVSGNQQLTGAIARLRAFVSIDEAAPVELASSVAGQGVEIGAGSDPGAYRWALLDSERTYNTSIRYSGKSTVPAEAVIAQTLFPEDGVFVSSVPAPPAQITPVPPGQNFTYAANQGTNLRVFIPAGTNVVSAAGGLIPDVPTNRALAGIPVQETSAGGLYYFVMPAGTPAGSYPLWEAYKLSTLVFKGPPYDEFVWDGGPIDWNGVAPTAPVSPALASSRYCTFAQLVSRFGLKNITQASNKDSAAATPNYAAIQDSFNAADQEVEDTLSPLYVVPLNFSGFANVVPAVVIRWVAILTYCDLYFARGLDEQDKRRNKLQDLVTSVKLSMAMYASGLRPLNAMTLSTVSGQSFRLPSDVLSSPSNNFGLRPIDGVITWPGMLG